MDLIDGDEKAKDIISTSDNRYFYFVICKFKGKKPEADAEQTQTRGN